MNFILGLGIGPIFDIFLTVYSSVTGRNMKQEFALWVYEYACDLVGNSKALDDLKKEYEGYWDERNALEKDLGELKAKARLGELNSAIENFTDEEKNISVKIGNKFLDLKLKPHSFNTYVQ